jgi:hypothetical protein
MAVELKQSPRKSYTREETMGRVLSGLSETG